MADEMFPERPLWRDIDKVKNTPHMNWGTCICSQCSIWRIVARVEAAEARLAAVCDRLEMFKRAGSMDAVTVVGLLNLARGEGDRPAEPWPDEDAARFLAHERAQRSGEGDRG